MNLRWRWSITKDWAIFFWRRTPTMFISEFRYRIWILVGRGNAEAEQLHAMITRISNLDANFAVYMSVKREQFLRQCAPECWDDDE